MRDTIETCAFWWLYQAQMILGWWQKTGRIKEVMTILVKNGAGHNRGPSILQYCLLSVACISLSRDLIIEALEVIFGEAFARDELCHLIVDVVL